MDTTLKNRKNKHLSSSECYKLEVLLKTEDESERDSEFMVIGLGYQ